MTLKPWLFSSAYYVAIIGTHHHPQFSFLTFKCCQLIHIKQPVLITSLIAVTNMVEATFCRKDFFWLLVLEVVEKQLLELAIWLAVLSAEKTSSSWWARHWNHIFLLFLLARKRFSFKCEGSSTVCMYGL